MVPKTFSAILLATIIKLGRGGVGWAAAHNVLVVKKEDELVTKLSGIS